MGLRRRMGVTLPARRGEGEEGSTPYVGWLDGLDFTVYSAIGFKKAFAVYAGNCCRIRNSTTTVEQDFGFGADGWVDTAGIVTFLGGASGTLRSFYNQTSAVGLDFGQTTTTAQPAIATAGVIITDDAGRPAMQFDGVDDYLSAPGQIGVFNGINGGTAGGNAQFSATGITQGLYVATITGAITASRFAFGRAASNGVFVQARNPDGGSAVTNIAGTPGAGWNAIIGRENVGVGSSIFLNGSGTSGSAPSSPPWPATDSNSIFIGRTNTQYYGGATGCIVAAQSALSDAQVATLNIRLNSLRGL